MMNERVETVTYMSDSTTQNNEPLRYVCGVCSTFVYVPDLDYHAEHTHGARYITTITP